MFEIGGFSGLLEKKIEWVSDGVREGDCSKGRVHLQQMHVDQKYGV